MPTALDLITTSAVKLGAIATGEVLTADEASDSLEVLNSMLDSWSIEKLMIYQIQQESLTWTGSAQSQTIGSAGDFNTTRPIKIEEGTFFRINSIDTPVRILKDRASYDSYPSKGDESSFPEVLYYEPSYPLGTLYVYPVPSANTTFLLNSWKALQSFATLTTDLALPPGYQWAIEHNLAVHLEPVFSVPVPSSVSTEAAISKRRLKRINHIPIVSPTETAYVINGKGRSDIEAGA